MTKEQAMTLLHHTDLKSVFAVWDELKGQMPDAELKRMSDHATRFLESLIFPRQSPKRLNDLND
ncbi:MAG TPA: hypothetical protein VFY60_16535 [Pyrinomonadaceae bacterium]|nr:hypothetical protein [Pyrinomonadaceae bacterium]